MANTSINIKFQNKTNSPGLQDSYLCPDALLTETFAALFARYQIPFDPIRHALRRTDNKTGVDAEGTVERCFNTFGKSLSKYTIYIVKTRPVIGLEPNNSGPSDTPDQSVSIGINGPIASLTIEDDISTTAMPNLVPGPSFSGVLSEEDTQAGNVIAPGQLNVQTAVRAYLMDHVSNHDMLKMREELLGLIQRNEFQKLHRMIPFTSGFLRTAFVDQGPK